MGSYGSFGAGMSSGLTSGTKLGKSWIDTFKQNKEEDIENALFKNLYESQDIMNQATGEMEQSQTLMDKIKGMTPDQTTGLIASHMAQSGAKMDGQMYMGIANLAQGLFQQQQQQNLSVEKLNLAKGKVENAQNLIYNRNQKTLFAKNKRNIAQTTQANGGKPFSYTPDGKIDVHSIDLKGEWYKNATSTIKNGIMAQLGITAPAMQYNTTKTNNSTVTHKNNKNKGKPTKVKVGVPFEDNGKWYVVDANKNVKEVPKP